MIQAFGTYLITLKPSRQRSLVGLDDIIAAGMNGFNILQTASKGSYCNDHELSNVFERGRRYLKTRYASNCSEESEIASHNCVYALSDPNEDWCRATPKCLVKKVCFNCFELFKGFQKIQEHLFTNTLVDSNTIYHVNNAIKDIIDYMKHMRDTQKKAKNHCFDRLEDDSAFWLKDFCQKILPARFWEGQKEYFGKKGMSLHAIFFTKSSDGSLQKKTFFTCLYQCE